jgi:hypothetical protein
LLGFVSFVDDGLLGRDFYLLVVTVINGNDRISFNFCRLASSRKAFTNVSASTSANSANIENFAHSRLDSNSAGDNGTSVASGLLHRQAAASTGGLRTYSFPQRGHCPIITSLSFISCSCSYILQFPT